MTFQYWSRLIACAVIFLTFVNCGEVIFTKTEIFTESDFIPFERMGIEPGAREVFGCNQSEGESTGADLPTWTCGQNAEDLAFTLEDDGMTLVVRGAEEKTCPMSLVEIDDPFYLIVLQRECVQDGGLLDLADTDESMVGHLLLSKETEFLKQLRTYYHDLGHPKCDNKIAQRVAEKSGIRIVLQEKNGQGPCLAEGVRNAQVFRKYFQDIIKSGLVIIGEPRISVVMPVPNAGAVPGPAGDLSSKETDTP